VIINIHGGPESHTARLSHSNNYYMNRARLRHRVPNVRGSEGYGKNFLKLDNGMLREGSVQRHFSVARLAVAARPRSGASEVTGGSYGGFMTLGRPPRITRRDSLRGRCCGHRTSSVSEDTESYRRDLRRANTVMSAIRRWRNTSNVSRR